MKSVKNVKEVVVVAVKGIKTGRPVNPNSVRQLRLNELEMKRANGLLNVDVL